MSSGKDWGNAVLVFDGVCNLCNGLVRFIIPRDPGGYFKFGTLQSVEGANVLERCGLSPGEADTVVLYEKGKCYIRSTAALRVFRRLRGLWPLLYGFIVVPRFLRDAVYTFVARRRYRWFGRRDRCMIPSPENKKRFL